jgi:hypothetical protein
MKSFNVGDLVRVSLFSLSAEWIHPPNNNTWPNPSEPTWAIGNNIPVLFSGNHLVNTGSSTSITPKTVNRANQINKRN